MTTSEADIDTAVQNFVNSTKGVVQLEAAGYERVRAMYQRKVAMDPVLRKSVTLSSQAPVGGDDDDDAAGTCVVGMIEGGTSIAVHNVSNGNGAAAAADDDDSDNGNTRWCR